MRVEFQATIFCPAFFSFVKAYDIVKEKEENASGTSSVSGVGGLAIESAVDAIKAVILGAAHDGE